MRYAVVGLALGALLGCEQASQDLPFEAGTGEAVSRVVGPEGAVVSTPEGLSVRFEAGSLDRPTEVTVLHRAGDDVGTPVDGVVVSGTVFDLGPSGVALDVPAALSLRVPRETLDTVNPNALTAVLVSGQERRYLSDASVDLGGGILRTALPRLGTVAVRVSDDVVSIGPGDVVPAGATAALAAPASPASLRTATFTMACGDTGEPLCSSSDVLSLTLTQELYDAMNGCVEFVDPVAAVDLTLEETGANVGRAAGTLVFSGTVRYQTGSDGTACGSGSGSVQSVAVSDTFSLGTSAEPWTSFEYDPATGTLALATTSDGPETLSCDCGADIFSASELWIGQEGAAISFEGLTGDVTYAIRVRR